MRSVRRREIQVLGYLLDRLEQLDDDGSVQSRCYQIRCMRTGAVVGEQPSLRAAKRWVVMRELSGFTQAQKREHGRSDVRAA